MQDVLSSFFQHTALTAGVTVRVSVSYMKEQSRVSAGRWFWSYHIRLENHRDDTIQLKSRHWRITDARGMVRIVDGEGVVGEFPVLKPGDTHDYVSGCELNSHRGSMEGFYTFTDADGAMFEVAIPFFPLAAPES